MIPKRLQAILWSNKTKNLDLKQDEGYIVNQVLSLGGILDLKWLFKTYGKNQIKRVFLHKPQKVYSPASLNFVRKFLLDLSPKTAPDYKYDQTIPRRIG